MLRPCIAHFCSTEVQGPGGGGGGGGGTSLCKWEHNNNGQEE